MPQRSDQRGITAISILMLLFCGGLAVLLILRVAPVYIEWYSVNNAIHSLNEELELRAKGPQEITTLIRKRFELNDVHSVNLRDGVQIKKVGNVLRIELQYEVTAPLFGNISLLFNFKKAWEFD